MVDLPQLSWTGRMTKDVDGKISTWLDLRLRGGCWDFGPALEAGVNLTLRPPLKEKLKNYVKQPLLAAQN